MNGLSAYIWKLCSNVTRQLAAIAFALCKVLGKSDRHHQRWHLYVHINGDRVTMPLYLKLKQSNRFNRKLARLETTSRSKNT
ncbi:hypothetical protein [Coleofasciculus sp. FACHB-SPT36]|uniref:hypothetical protein n=1 Tax=Coleofasciculus sp. FACHB-SPT36 TaxID=2692790 RepID=UPI00168AFCC6|nr:hypothetical protein [Coleofasciculus sp. FACHB-SPT36]